MDRYLKNLETELQSLRLLTDPRVAVNLSVDNVKSGELTAERLGQIEMFARRAKELVQQFSTPKKVEQDEENEEKLGQHATIKFVSMNNKEVKAKVDTGATTSSLHATNISVNQNNNTVSFVAPDLSENKITMQLVGNQEVHSADGGGQQRPVISFDIEINGTLIKNAEFNLNDRSNMDTPILIGQNVLKAGDFVVDVSHNNDSDNSTEVSNNDSTSMVAKNQATEPKMEAQDYVEFYNTFHALKPLFDRIYKK